MTTTTKDPDIARLARWLTRTHKWFALCDALSAAKGTPAEPAALDAWRRGSMPSKSSKHDAYDLAGRLIRRYELEVGHPSTVADLDGVLAAARVAVR